MFPVHDPYYILIPSLAKYWNYDVQLTKQSEHPHPRLSCSYCEEISDHLKTLLSGWKPYLQQVRDAYSQVPTKFDYNSRYQKGIYILAYFPFYIEPIYYSLETIYDQITLQKENKLTLSFLGGGPLPELLGISKLIDEKRKDVQTIAVQVFDKYQNWIAELKNCTQPLVSNYYNGKTSYRRFEVDLINLEDNNIESIINADIIVLQNTINDISFINYSALKNSLLKIWNSIKPRTILIILDLNFNEVKKFMESLQIELVNNGGKLISKLNDIPIEHRPNIPFCSHLDKMLFSNQSGLMPRRRVNYYRFVIKK